MEEKSVWMKRIISSIKTSFKDGLLHIFGSSFISKLCGLISSIFVIRLLDKIDYGYYVSASNLYSYVAIFLGYGLTSTILQFCCENYEKEKINAYFKFGLKNGNFFNFVLVVVMLIFSLIKFLTNNIEVALFLLLMSFYPIFIYIDTYFETTLRCLSLNKQFSYVNISRAVLQVFFNILLTIFFGVYGLILSIYLTYFITSVIGFLVLKKHNFFYEIKNNSALLQKSEVKELNSFSFYCAITNFVSTVLVLLDVTCLDLVLSDPEVLADYKVASTIPISCMFVSAALMTYFYPKLVAKKKFGLSLFKKYIVRILITFFIINLFVFIILFFGAPLIIRIIYGAKYMNIITIFRVLSVHFLIMSSFDKVLGNVILVLKKVKINLIISVISGIVNIIIDVFLIINIGSIGAALATILVSLLVATLEFFYLVFYFRRENKIAF